MAKVICKEYFYGKKCACGRRLMWFFAFAGDEKNFDEVGLCGQCFAELLGEFGYEVYKPGEKIKKEVVLGYADRWNEKFKKYSGGYVGRVNVQRMLTYFLRSIKREVKK